MKRLNKKGVLGFETAKSVILILLILGVVCVALFLALTTLVPTISTVTGVNSNSSVTNESLGTVANNTGLETFSVVGSFHGLVCTITKVTNVSGNVQINEATGNWSQSTASDGSNCAIDPNSLTGTYNNTGWQVIYSFTYDKQTTIDSENVQNNITSGVVKFMSYIPTIFTILAIVVIILAIALILYAVNRFGGGAGREGGL